MDKWIRGRIWGNLRSRKYGEYLNHPKIFIPKIIPGALFHIICGFVSPSNLKIRHIARSFCNNTKNCNYMRIIYAVFWILFQISCGSEIQIEMRVLFLILLVMNIEWNRSTSLASCSLSPSCIMQKKKSVQYLF